MKKFLTLLAAVAILSVVALGAAQDGQWAFQGTDTTAPKNLSIHVSGATLSGTLDGLPLTGSGVTGPFFWFHVVRSGSDFLYKGQVKNGNLVLNEVGPSGTKSLTYAPAP
jgi:hypothetical protein